MAYWTHDPLAELGEQYGEDAGPATSADTYTLPPITTVDEARDAAIDWSHWVGEQSLSYGELFEWQQVWERIGRQFGLMDEFNENGIV